MPAVADLLRFQLDFTAWADERALNAAAGLTAEELSVDFKSSEKTILNTLAHIYRAERVWINRLWDKKVDFQVEGDGTLAALQTNWPEIRSAWKSWALPLTDQDTATDLTYYDLRGNVWTQPIWPIVMHAVNHSTHHRGQVIGFMRALGHTPPNVDLITFVRESSNRALAS